MSADSGAGGCPFLINTRPRNATPTSSTPASPSSERAAAAVVPISELIDRIIKDQLGLTGVDTTPYVNVLEKNLIMNGRILLGMKPELLHRLQLPLALENALIQAIEAHSGSTAAGTPRLPPRRGNSRNMRSKKQTTEEKSALLGISEEMRRAIKESWALITAKSGVAVGSPEASNLNKFFDEFYKNFLEMDKTARKLFDGVSMVRQAQALMKIMVLVMQAIDNPARLIHPLRKMGVRHLIYGVERKNFQAFGVSLAKTAEHVLGDQCAPATKEAYYVLIMALGEIMMEDYDEIRAGYTGRLFKKDGSKWRLFYTNLTHDKLVLYKDEERTKTKEEIDLTLLDSMELEESEQIGNVARLNPFCFSLTASSLVKSFFCAETEEDLLNWTDSLTQRIKAHQRVNRVVDSDQKVSQASDSDDSLDSSTESESSVKRPGSSKSKAAKKIRHLKNALGKKSVK